MEGPKDDLKWFGEGFDGFPKRLPEDCVEYMLLIIDATLAPKELLARLETVRKEATKLTERLLKDYIWQREEFNLKLEVDNQNGSKYLHGLTNYGDSVEDEWLIVYLLRELSKLYPDIWIKVADTDGEFLLIEAANALPRWLNPEIADNRVWINNNKLRIIPLAAVSTSPETKTAPVSRALSLVESQQIISKTPEILIHSPLVEAEAFYRLRNYPSQINASLHHARITIPRKLVYLLHNCQASIAPAVEAFYLRDPVALKPLQNSPSALILPPEDLVTVSVKFTRVLYAQLKSQQFSPPMAWRAILTKAEKTKSSDDSQKTEYSRLEIGMKVTSGFEMLLTDPKNKDNRSVRQIDILISDLNDGEFLPTDGEISAYKDSNREDSEDWLDINFEDFEKELSGKARNAKPAGPEGAFGPDIASGFGDAKTQADLKKMVERFEAFLNDEDAGIDGAEVDDMDFDDDEEDDEDDDSEDEDKDVSFDENEFARMMREMMGMPPEGPDSEPSGGVEQRNKSKNPGRVEELDSDDDDGEDEEGEEDEGEEIRKVMARIEAELNEAGALDLDPTPKKLAALRSKNTSGRDQQAKSKGKQPDYLAKQDWEDDDDESDDDNEVDIDFNLAKNLLESFKSQAGMAGPGGNMIGMMGLTIPRDEDDGSSQQGQGKGKRIG